MGPHGQFHHFWPVRQNFCFITNLKPCDDTVYISSTLQLPIGSGRPYYRVAEAPLECAVTPNANALAPQNYIFVTCDPRATLYANFSLFGFSYPRVAEAPPWTAPPRQTQTLWLGRLIFSLIVTQGQHCVQISACSGFSYPRVAEAPP